MTKTKILIGLSSLIFLSFSLTQGMLIKPGQSVGPFYIDKTTLGEIHAHYGKGKYKSMVFIPTTSDSGMHHYHKLIFEKKGIAFSFKTLNPKKKDVIENIELFNKFNAATDYNIRVSFSTRGDIYKAYGKDHKNTGNAVAYNDKGITFEFTKSDYMSENLIDTVTKIVIFKKGQYF